MCCEDKLLAASLTASSNTENVMLPSFFLSKIGQLFINPDFLSNININISRSAAGQAVTWCALSLCIANSLNQQYGAAAPGDEKPGPFFGDPML